MPSDTREGTPPISDGRSCSPGEKRPASEITDSDPEGGVSTGGAGNARNSENVTSDEITYPTPSSSGTRALSSPLHDQSDPEIHSSDEMPTVDEQVAEVNKLMNEPKQNRQKGYVVSMLWLKQVLARTTSHADHPAESLQDAVGPVDNLDIALDLDPATTSFKYESGEAFVPMRPGLQDAADFVILPQPAWELIQKWYGLAGSSPAIVRYAYDVSQPGNAAKIEYETYPLILSIFKLSNPSAATTPTTLKEKNLPSVKILTSRQKSFQKWLKEAKQMAGIDMATKVRVWKLHRFPLSTNTSNAVTPAASRAASPAPPSAIIPNTADKLLLDLHAFLALSESTDRVLLEGVKDETNNPKYNGRMSLDLAGLGSADCIVLEEQLGGSKGGDWVSEASAKTLKRLGIPVDLKNEKSTAPTIVTQTPLSSGRSTPAPGSASSINLFGRGRKGRLPRVRGLENLGNTCYMNSALQCVRSIEELTLYFLSGKYKPELNPGNVIGYRGEIAKQWADLLKNLYNPDSSSSFLNPSKFRRVVGRHRSQFAGFDQHDSQEFMLFLLDALSEDLCRIDKKPYYAELNSTNEMVTERHALEEFGEKCWQMYESRNASVITDLFAGMEKSTLICPDCQKTSISMDPFTLLSLPIPPGPQPLSQKIIFVPQQGPPVRLVVQLDAKDTLKTWKDFVAKKMGIDNTHILAAETHNSVFWRFLHQEDDCFNSLDIKTNDVIVFYELGPVSTQTDDDTVIIPVFHRQNGTRKNKRSNPTPFAIPSFICLSPDETKDFETIYNKLLQLSANMTTRDILNLDQGTSDDRPKEEIDSIVSSEDDYQTTGFRIKTSSVDGENGIVDISMDEAQTSRPAEDTEMSDSDSDSGSEIAKSPQHPLIGKIATGLLALFDVKVMGNKSNSPKLPDGRSVSGAKELPLVSSRISAIQASNKESDEEPRSSTQILRQGDAVVLDWSSESFDSLFGGENRASGDLRGAPTYEELKTVYDGTKRETAKESPVTLEECLDLYSKPEILSADESWYCPDCKVHVQAMKQLDLWKAPDIIAIHFKRFNYSELRRYPSKISTRIDFPLEGLDLTERAHGPNNGKSLEYDLIAVDNQRGSMNFGHYTAYMKDFISGDWYYCNDSSTHLVTKPQTIVSAEAYVLFYRRRSERPLGNPELQELVEAYRNSSGGESGSSSRSQSCAEGGPHPADHSHTGSSSASAKTKAAPQAGISLRIGSAADDEYSTTDGSDANSGDGEGMKLTSDGLETGGQMSDPLDIFQEPSWSFDNLTSAHALSQINPANASLDESGLFDDDDEIDSNLAVDDDDRDPDTRMTDLGDAHSVRTSQGGGSFEDVSHLMDDDSDDELPVVELRVGDDDKMTSD